MSCYYKKKSDVSLPLLAISMRCYLMYFMKYSILSNFIRRVFFCLKQNHSKLLVVSIYKIRSEKNEQFKLILIGVDIYEVLQYDEIDGFGLHIIEVA